MKSSTLQQHIPYDSLPCREDLSRVDTAGRAYRGSQRQIQSYVNEYPDLLNHVVAEHLSIGPQPIEITWVSPIKSNKYTEYRDDDFLRCLGLEQYRSSLQTFWPRGGPCWDALARFKVEGSYGCFLVEAKSHVPEIYGKGCQAVGRSLIQIKEALAKTKVWLGVDVEANWTGHLYQLANRYAHLYFLREIVGVHAYLINLYFTNDPHSQTSFDIWMPAIDEVNRELGLKSQVPFARSVFLDALK